ncbi:MAG TPA: twin-arginine translocase TatA/TatE family subunit, partial [Terriglobia bacterium]|nr:twin-arginine translocase TatA/TatE family subunit [Terriglobia bacterium]
FLDNPEPLSYHRHGEVSRLFTGGFEFVFLLFIAFLLFGPKKLPEIARVLGKGLGELRRASNELKTSLEDEIRNLDRDTETQRRLAASNPPPPYTREHRENVQEARDVLDTAVRSLDHELGASPGGLTETVTDNGHEHRESAHGEPGTRS